MPKRKITIGPEIDLDDEEVILDDGRRLTDEVVDSLLDEARTKAARRPGRPTMSAADVPSSNLTIRVTSEMRTSLNRLAAEQGRNVADVAREALSSYIAAPSDRERPATAELERMAAAALVSFELVADALPPEIARRLRNDVAHARPRTRAGSRNKRPRPSNG